MKLSVIYDSKTGNTKQTAGWIADGMNTIADAAAKALAEGNLDYDPDAHCDHHEHHGGDCGHHQCGEHRCGVK